MTAARFRARSSMPHRGGFGARARPSSRLRRPSISLVSPRRGMRPKGVKNRQSFWRLAQAYTSRRLKSDGGRFWTETGDGASRTVSPTVGRRLVVAERRCDRMARHALCGHSGTRAQRCERRRDQLTTCAINPRIAAYMPVATILRQYAAAPSRERKWFSGDHPVPRLRHARRPALRYATEGGRSARTHGVPGVRTQTRAKARRHDGTSRERQSTRPSQSIGRLRSLSEEETDRDDK
jgi:hypothetical protein